MSDNTKVCEREEGDNLWQIYSAKDKTAERQLLKVGVKSARKVLQTFSTARLPLLKFSSQLNSRA